MAIIKRIVCLANSRKLSGRCIAGIELSGTQRLGWIRPVSAREHEEVSEHERQYEDGADPRVLDAMDVPLIKPLPKAYQQENWLLEPDYYWKKSGRVSSSELAPLVDPVESLWIDGDHTKNGRNDRISLDRVAELTSSLRLISVKLLTLSVFTPGEAFGNPKRRVQGRFVHHGTHYKLWVTDPAYECAYLLKPDGNYEIGESFLTVSLGEPHNGACYKLVAAIIERAKS